VPDFRSMWLGDGKSFSERLREQLAPKKDLRNKIEQAIRALELQNRKLEVALKSLREKDRYYYNKVVSALKEHDRSKAVIYANELAELRKAVKSISTAKLALEQIILRLSTVRDIGDIMVAISPAMSVVKGVKENITQVLPQAESELAEIQDMLTKILVDAGQMTGLTVDFRVANEQAEKILREAEEHVEKELRERLPGIPELEESSEEEPGSELVI